MVSLYIKGWFIVLSWTQLTWVMLCVKFGREEWGIHIVGTVQSSHTGGGRLFGQACYQGEGKLKKGTHESLLSSTQHQAWVDNNFVKTLSNFHSPTIVQGGMKRRVRDPVTKKRAREQTGDVDCNAQQD